MEVIQTPEVAERRAGIAEITGQETLQNEIAVIAKQINRSPDFKFSITGAEFMEQSMELVNAITENGLGTVYDINKGGSYSLKSKYNNIDLYVSDFVFNDLVLKDIIYQPIDKPFARMLQKVTAGKRGKEYEQFIINRFKNVDGIKLLQETQTEEGDLPDVYAKLYNQPFNVEVKMGNFQAGSVTMNSLNINTGEMIIKKSLNNDDGVRKVGAKTLPGWKALQKRAKELGVEMNFANDPMPLEVYATLKEEGYLKGITKFDVFDQNMVAEIYNNKKYPTYYIQIQGKGLYYMGKNPMSLNIPELKGKVIFKFRPVRGAVSKKGLVRINFRGFPTFETIETKSNIDLGTDQGMKDFMADSSVKEHAKYSKSLNSNIEAGQTVSNAINASNESKIPKGISVLDFDDTLATSKSLIRYTTSSGEKGTLTPEQYASEYQDMQDLGYSFDFSEFNKVVDGKTAPLFKKALKLQGKFGADNMFVLTARPAESAAAIFAFLKANGLNIPLKNITGLANSTSEAKALWVAEKVGESYNDFYFADDALQNVQAVKNMLDQFDVKSKVQQAKVKFSESLSPGFNKILEESIGIERNKTFSKVKAVKRGKNKGKFRPFIPPGAEDFKGLMKNFLGKGEQGDAHNEFFEKALYRPYSKAYRNINESNLSMSNNYSALRKKFPDVTTKLGLKSLNKDFSNGDAIRVYLWNKNNIDIPGMSESDLNSLVNIVESNTQMKLFAQGVGVISKQKDGYVTPNKNWIAGNIASDLYQVGGKSNRKQFLKEWTDNKNEIFNEQNLNKIEAEFGPNFRSALEDILYRMETGSNRPRGLNKLTNTFLNWINSSVGAIMFFNGRSATLQTMSMVNFINYADNNVLAAGKAFSNQKQYWEDFSTIWNSNYQKARRKGLKQDINAAEMVESIKNSDSKVEAVIAKLLEIGFTPTKLADSFAIASGGSTFYRNRINTYVKDGLSKKESEEKAFNDFMEIAEETQQSSRPDFISQQQASLLGHWLLAFQNTPMQMSRLMKKAALDLIKRRKTLPNKTQTQSDVSNVSRIIYYGAVQNAIFYSLQSALFALAFDDEEIEEEQKKTKYNRVASGMLDSILRGTGIYGAIVATSKNVIIKMIEEGSKNYSQTEAGPLVEALNLSPPIGSKARKFQSAQRTWRYNKEEIKSMDVMDFDNPAWEAAGNLFESATNVPTGRLISKAKNMEEALNSDNQNWQRIALFLGWSRWDVGIDKKNLKEGKIKTRSIKNRQIKTRTIK